MNPFKIKGSQKRGQGLVEFALTLPILLVIMVGIMEVGRLLFIYTSVVNASREAVRFGSATGSSGGVPQYYDCTGIEDAAMLLGTISGFDGTGITVTYDNGNVPSPTFKYTCADLASNPTYTIETGDRIVVTVTATYTPVLQYLGLQAIPSFPITSTSSRTIVGNIALEGMGPGAGGGSGPTNRPVAPVPQLPLFANPSVTSGGHCSNITVHWLDAPQWWSDGIAPPNYFRVRFAGDPWQPSTSLHWYYSTDFDIKNGDQGTFWIKAWFSGGPPSEMLKVTVECNSGVLTVVSVSP